ncbi:Dihydrofolate reductase type A13 [Burkholderia gladioli]|uniref:dihydrofolate reductase n=1 Tax=Burkholderia gladioli TaxID=28095 RepID=UPI00039CF251|nr:dihydrofolate reductase [Burkholderia gladioli]NHH79786.1 Dihydrofolate reductase type 3 [Burkholderia gladioli]CAG9195244.1 Dihydrofolate reductase type A13 [Burkholderia gladioli]
MLAGKQIVMVAAMAANRVIGFGKDIPWTIPGEQKRFRELTMGQLLVMGRLTFESIGRPLPGRDVVVLSSRDEALAGARRAACFEALVDIIRDDPRERVLIGGGQQIYERFLPFADVVHLTEIDLQVPGDTFFPTLPARFTAVDRVEIDGAVAHAFVTYASASPDGDLR